jgi:hypothetical protein
MDASSNEEARRAKRVPVGLPVTLRYVERGQKVQHRCVTVDLSPFGVRVQGPDNLLVGQNLRILPDEPVGDSIPARIVWVVSAQPNQSAQAGIEFLDPLHLPA